MSNAFKLVPVEATEAMTLAACDSYFDSDSSAWTAMAGAYRAMLAAAPQPPALGGEPHVVGYMPDHPDGDPLILLEDFHAHLAPLQAEIERHKANAEEWEKASLHWMAERDQLKARCDAREALLREIHNYAQSFEQIPASCFALIEAALSKPAGSEQV